MYIIVIHTCTALEFMKQIRESPKGITATYLEDGTVYFMKNEVDVGKLLNISPSVIRKALPQNILKYHK